ncbi:MAG: DALR anticodon-binding domain-containing protein, partial [Bacteroidia bacterium]
YPEVLKEAAESYSPAVMANYLYDLARDFNRFYHDCKVLNPEKPHLSAARFAISTMVGKALKNGLATLGIETPDKM